MLELRIVGRMSRADRALLDDLLHEASECRISAHDFAGLAQREIVSQFQACVRLGATFTARRSPLGWRLHWERRRLYGWFSLRHLAEACGSIPQESA